MKLTPQQKNIPVQPYPVFQRDINRLEKQFPLHHQILLQLIERGEARVVPDEAKPI